MKLSVKKIEKTKPTDKQISLSDGNGLYIRVKPNGSKIWIFRYTKPGTKKVGQMGMGNFPSVTLAEAREMATEYQKLLSQRLDPKIELEKKKAQAIYDQKNTLKAIAEDWYTTQDHIEEKTLRDKKAKLRMYVFPFMGDLPITEITTPLAKAAFDNLAKANKLSVLHRTLNIVMV